MILAWRPNSLGTNVHLWPFIMEARRAGAKLYTIDPRRNRTGAAADKHFFINPGSDTALALAMMHVILGENLHDADYVERYTEGIEALRERVREWTPQRAAPLTGIAGGEIAALAREYPTTRPAVIRLNYGVQRSEQRVSLELGQAGDDGRVIAEGAIAVDFLEIREQTLRSEERRVGKECRAGW